MNLLYRLFVILSLFPLAAFCSEKALQDAQPAEKIAGANILNHPLNTDEQNEVLNSALVRAQAEIKELIVALGYSRDFKKAGNMEEFLKRNPDFTAEVLVALARDYNSYESVDKSLIGTITNAAKTGANAIATGTAYIAPLSLAGVIALIAYYGRDPLTASVFLYLGGAAIIGTLGTASVLALAMPTFRAVQNSSTFNRFMHGKTIELNSKIPINSLAQTNSFVTCHLGTPDGPWVWLEDSYGNTIPGAWGKVTENSWSLGTVESPTSLKARCGKALLNKYPGKGKISPKDVLVFASTRLNKHPITYYVDMGRNAFKLSDILLNEEIE